MESAASPTGWSRRTASAVMFFHPTDPQYVFCVTGAAYSENVDTICAALTSLSRYEA